MFLEVAIYFASKAIWNPTSPGYAQSQNPKRAQLQQQSGEVIVTFLSSPTSTRVQIIVITSSCVASNDYIVFAHLLFSTCPWFSSVQRLVSSGTLLSWNNLFTKPSCALCCS
eukprot:1122173-Amphidinium_carterae.3